MPLDDRLDDCFAQAHSCSEKGIVDEQTAFALLRRAYGVGYLDGIRERPEDGPTHDLVLDAWETTASVTRALAGVMANRRRGGSVRPTGDVD